MFERFPVRLKLIKKPTDYTNKKGFQGGEIEIFSKNSEAFSKISMVFKEVYIGRKTDCTINIYARTDNINELKKLEENLDDEKFSSDLQVIENTLEEVKKKIFLQHNINEPTASVDGQESEPFSFI